MFLYLFLWAIWNKPRLLLTMLRILAWPPSRARYDKARLG